MDETILFPSPNWFQVSGLAVSKDSWLVYGGPSKSLCVLEPLPLDYNTVVVGNRGYKAHILSRAHPEKIVSVDISPEWPENRSFLTGSADGTVKQWILEGEGSELKIKSKHSHEAHYHEKEEVAGVGYSTEVYAITVGCFGNIVKWDLKSNVVKTYGHFLKSLKATCMSCSQHLPLHVAIGTKQGVLFVVDLNGSGKILYKVRGQDDEINNVSWCPQYDVAVKKSLKILEKKFSASDRLQKIRNEPEPYDIENESSGSKVEVLEASGFAKTLPDDSFDESVVVEDDMFDIYKDHEADEFGHKKYKPEDIVVKVEVEEKKDDYLAECLKLKEEILKRKNQPESSIESLVEALQKSHVETKESTSQSEAETCKPREIESESSDHTHKHLLASIGKFGGVRIWSKSGKLVGSCVVSNTGGKSQRNKLHHWPTLLWYKPDTLLIADGKSQLLECNPLKIDCKNKLEWRVIHTLHKRGLYGIATGAPRVQPAGGAAHWDAWTVSQDRNLIRYSMENRNKVAVYATCGGFLYSAQTCPYDAGKIAISVGDGAIRVWETSTLEEDDNRLSPGVVTSYWQNVQGKVLTVSWHPTRENLLAFGTAEARVGLLDVGGKHEKPARALLPALAGGVYDLCWGEAHDLYACGGGQLALYRALRPDEAPELVKVELEGQRWEISAARWYTHGLAVGSGAGAVAVLAPAAPHALLAATFVFSKMIHTIDWHPQETSTLNEPSPSRNLIAVCSLDKSNSIVILEYGDKDDGSKQLTTWRTLAGHRGAVLQVAWNPHRDAQLLSTSQDATVRIWDVEGGTCSAIFGGHVGSSLSAAWSAFPQLGAGAGGGVVVSGGGDCALRLWRADQHPPEAYQENKREPYKKEKKRKDKKDQQKREEEPTLQIDTQVATTQESIARVSKKFLLPVLYQHTKGKNIAGVKRMFQRYLEKSGDTDTASEEPGDLPVDYTKVFGTINEVNELLDMELKRHRETGSIESWLMLSIFRGHIDAMIQYASLNDLLCPYLLSIAPCVSLKYWKDVTQLYLAQVDRLVAAGEEEKLYESKWYGGAVYRRAATLLSVHDVRGAVAALAHARLYKEAYMLCRIRYMDSVAEQTLHEWAGDSILAGNLTLGAICYLALGDLSKAVAALGKSNDQDCLSLAAQLAKHDGQATFADHIEKKVLTKAIQIDAGNTEEELDVLPSRIELLMIDSNKAQNGEAGNEALINGDSIKED